MAEKTNEATPLTEEQLKERTEALTAGEEQLKNDRKAFEKEKKYFEDGKKESPAEKSTPGLEFDFQGLKKKFKDDAPKKIRYDGKVWTQKELVGKKEDAQEALNDLVSSNSNLFENL